MPLPLFLEQTDRWYYFAVPLGAPIILLFLVFPLIGFFRGGFQPKPLVALAGMILPVWFIFSNVGWQFRMDREGIELSAPLNPFEGAGRIAWRDLKTVEFVSKTTRGGTTKMLEFDGVGTTLDIGSLSGLPKAFWPALFEAIRTNAPQAKVDGGSMARWLALADEDAQAGWLTLVGRSYVLRDGNGKQLAP